jgi:uncharacterized membrane protein HdeD (DUF308 family)
MKNSQLYLGALVLGVLALIVGLLMLSTSLFGTHHTLPLIALVVGAILVIVGVAGMVVMRR